MNRIPPRAVRPLRGSIFLLLWVIAGAATDQSGPESRDAMSGPRLDLSPTTFPAARDCEYKTKWAGECPEPVYATFVLTYTVGVGTVFNPSGSISTIPAYRYGGGYRTDPEYTQNSIWMPPQGKDPAAPNFTTVTVEDNPFGPVGTTVRLLGNQQLKVDFHDRVGPGARIRITFGDRSGGSPGFLVPTIPQQIDLVVEEDPDGDGSFRLVGTEMPTLRTVGTRVDRFVVTAPSTPAAEEFEIHVRAVEGKDAIDRSLYLVPGYTGVVRFRSTDPAAVLPEEYSFSFADNGVARLRVTSSSPGIHTIEVVDPKANVSGRSNPIRTGTGDYRLFWGALHQHTNIGGHGAQSEPFAFEYGRDVSRLDFLAMTEHCSSRNINWDYSTRLGDQFNEPGRFVTFTGYEWGINAYGHRHVVFLDARRELRHCPRNDRWTRPTRTLEDLFAGLADREALIIPHHTGWDPGPESSVVLGSDPNQVLFEVYSKHGSSERFDNAPYPIHRNPEFQRAPGAAYFQEALAAGHRFGVTSGTDDHHGMPGGQVSLYTPTSPGTSYSRTGLTAVFARRLTRKDLWEGLKARRTYGTTGARILLDVRVDGRMMGEEITVAGPPEIVVEVAGTAFIERVVLVRNGTTEVYRETPDREVTRFNWVDDEAIPGREYSYYVRVEQRDGHLAWSSPIWIRVE